MLVALNNNFNSVHESIVWTWLIEDSLSLLYLASSKWGSKSGNWNHIWWPIYISGGWCWEDSPGAETPGALRGVSLSLCSHVVSPAWWLQRTQVYLVSYCSTGNCFKLSDLSSVHLSHGSCGSNVWVWLHWALCSGSLKATVKALAGLHSVGEK